MPQRLKVVVVALSDLDDQLVVQRLTPPARGIPLSMAATHLLDLTGCGELLERQVPHRAQQPRPGAWPASIELD